MRGVPEDAEECGSIPAPQEQAHLRGRVRAAPPQNRRVKNKPQRAGEQKARNHAVAKEPVDQCGFAHKKNGDEQLCRNSSEHNRQRFTAAFLVGLDVHDFAEKMRMHGEHGAKQESLPRKLRHFVQPAAQNEDQQIAALDENVEGRTALPGKRPRVVHEHRQEKRGQPRKKLGPGPHQEQKQKWSLDRGDLPAQSFELRSFAARSEHVRAFAWIVAVAVGVRDVVDAVEKKTKRKQNVDEAGPKACRAPVKFPAKGHEIEKRSGSPQTGTGNLE